MSAKIIDSHRYEKITKTELAKRKKKEEQALKNTRKKKEKKTPNIDTTSNISNVRIKKMRERKLEREMLLYSRPERTVLKEPKKKIYIPKSFIITVIVLFLLLLVFSCVKLTKLDKKIIGIIESRNIEKEEKEENKEKEDNKVSLENNYNLRVSLVSLGSRELNASRNLIVNDMYRASNYSLVDTKDNYTLEYVVAKSIEKISNTEYNVILDSSYKLDVDDVIFSIDKIRENSSSIYFNRVENIENITKNGDDSYNFKITLKSPNPYFVYDLDFPLLDNASSDAKLFNYSISNGDVVFTRSPKNPNMNLNTVTLKEYNSVEECVDAFRNGDTDMFFASSNNEMQLIGKNDYNLKKYKDGETLFIFGNKESNIFKRKEIRSALMYSLNREEIVKSSDNNFIEVIDLPYLYSSIKYKYDLVGARNTMNSSSWNTNGYGYYEKQDENGGYLSATLRLLVNGEDQNKVNVANSIKAMAQNAGINIEIMALPRTDVEAHINAKDYDLVLATVYLDETPDISFLKDYLNITDKTDEAFRKVEESSIEELSANIQNLEETLSDEVSCIGIYARNINLVYQKYIYGFENLNYMKIFSNLEKIGKLVE